MGFFHVSMFLLLFCLAFFCHSFSSLSLLLDISAKNGPPSGDRGYLALRHFEEIWGPQDPRQRRTSHFPRTLLSHVSVLMLDKEDTFLKGEVQKGTGGRGRDRLS